MAEQQLELPQWQPDPTTFNDLVAQSTEWHPCTKGGFNYRTHKLVKQGETKLKFRATAVAYTLPGFVILIGAIILYPAPPVGIIILLIGLSIFMPCTTPFTFDKSAGLCWKGWLRPKSSASDPEKNIALIRDVHAIQLIRKSIWTNQGSFDGFELNVVLKDGRRINVFSHSRQAQIRKDAAAVAGFLGIPAWDGCGE